MYREQMPIPTEDLQIGMYVSKLDRPWLETPFLFQGFLIEDGQVIEQLRQYCQTVYVDVAKYDATLRAQGFVRPTTTIVGDTKRGAERRDERATEEESGHEDKKSARKKHKRGTKWRLFRGRDSSDERSGAEIPDDESTVRLKLELKNAKNAHETADAAISDAFMRLRKGAEIDIGTMQEAVTPMVESICRNEDALSWLARMKKKNDYVYDHSIASSVWAMVFAKYLNLDKADIELIGLGAMFMDVGKTRIADELLVKQDRLTPDEVAELRRHVEHGIEICEKIGGLDPRVMQIVRSHHERYNGSGYPDGLKGNDIPIFARIAGIVDVYDAMTTPRPYAEPSSTSDALRHLNRLAGVEFQAEMVEQFVQAVGVFPVGTLVELNTGEVGVVVAQNRVRRLRPQIMVLTDPDKQILPRFRVKDLRNELLSEQGQSLWIERGLAIGTYGIDPSEYFI